MSGVSVNHRPVSADGPPAEPRLHPEPSAPMTSPTTTGHLRSMTGQGHAEREDSLGMVSAEVRTVNHRGFKCSFRTPDGLGWVEARLEKLARSRIHRGAVYLTIRWQRPPGGGLPAIDHAALEKYYRELAKVRDALGEPVSIDLTRLAELPGVVVQSTEDWREHEGIWDVVRGTVEDAIDNLNEMRRDEGRAMRRTLVDECVAIRRRLDEVIRLAPQTLEAYQTRLEGKVRRVLEQNGLEVPTVDLLREIQLYADRSDISEETTRLASHLQMFESILGGDGDGDTTPEAAGRKLDFVIQEMFRETNTIGSKASHAEISSHVVEIKCAIERMRELVQNLE